MEALKKALESNPQGRWWIKADVSDVRKGLREGMRRIWAGVEDLGDGCCRQCIMITKQDVPL